MKKGPASAGPLFSYVTGGLVAFTDGALHSLAAIVLTVNDGCAAAGAAGRDDIPVAEGAAVSPIVIAVAHDDALASTVPVAVVVAEAELNHGFGGRGGRAQDGEGQSKAKLFHRCLRQGGLRP